MRTLSGSEQAEFSRALRNAYNAPQLKRMLLHRLDRDLDDISMGANLQEVAFELIRTAESEGWTADLLQAARESNPGNPMLLAFEQQLGLGTAEVPRGSALERVLRETNSFLDVAGWRARLGRLEAQVCRVEITTTDRDSNRRMFTGTGFLLGPDVVMTNYHVVDAAILGEQGGTTADGRKATRDDVRLRFDYTGAADNGETEPGTVYRLADDWLIHASPPGPDEDKPPPRMVLPRPDELDYALLRLATPAGSEPIGERHEPDARQRGWIEVPKAAYRFAAGTPLFILQHPDKQPLRLAFDTDSVRGLNTNGTRVAYNTNTLPGSSGSPCFNQHWELVALHRARDPNFDLSWELSYNVGVPFSVIAALLGQRQFNGVLGAAPP